MSTRSENLSWEPDVEPQTCDGCGSSMEMEAQSLKRAPDLTMLFKVQWVCTNEECRRKRTETVPARQVRGGSR